MRPSWIYPTDDEPDPRFSMANERTFLAWVRTALGVLAAAVGLHVLEVPDAFAARRALVVSLCLFGGLMVVAAYLRWARVERAMRRQEPLPPFALGLVMTGLFVVVAVGLAIELALTGDRI